MSEVPPPDGEESPDGEGLAGEGTGAEGNGIGSGAGGNGAHAPTGRAGRLRPAGSARPEDQRSRAEELAAPAFSPVTSERFGRPFRHFSAAVSATAMALSWSHKEGGPHGATVLVDHEVSALGRIGTPWKAPAEATLACAVILRPPLAADDADLMWLVGALGLVGAMDELTERRAMTWWPDAVLDAVDGHTLGSVKADVELAPGQVRAGVLTLRADLVSLGLDRSRREDLLEAIVSSLDRTCEILAEGAAGVAGAYEARCGLLGKRVKCRLRPKGETRGVTSGVDTRGWLQLKSGTGMVERITLDMLRDLEVV